MLRPSWRVAHGQRIYGRKSFELARLPPVHQDVQLLCIHVRHCTAYAPFPASSRLSFQRVLPFFHFL